MAAAADPSSNHDAAVIQAEARHLVRTLAPYRVLHRDALRQLAGTRRWHQCSYERALAAAVRSGAIERLAEEFYSYPAEG
jgi:hypothetical protein